MHILISAVSGSRSPSGICRHAANLASGLAGSSEVEKVTLVVGCWQRNYFRKSFALGDPKLHLVSVDIGSSTISRNVWYLVGLPKLIAQHSPDVVHLSFPIPFLKRQIRPVVVTTIHDLYPYDLPEHFGRFRALFNRWFLRVCIRGSEHLTCVSDVSRRRLLQLFPSVALAKVSRIHNIVDNAFRSARKPCAELVTTRPFVLAVAQHRKNKRLKLLIMALARLLACGDLHPSTLLFLVGNSGPETGRLQKVIADLHLESNVQVMRGLPDPEMAWLYTHCLLFASPSVCEGFNLPLAEAITAGARVVCSDIPVHREIGGDACGYFDSASPHAVLELTSAIRRSLHHPSPERRRMEMFSSEVIIARYVALYQSLTGTSASAPEHMESSHESRAS